MGTRPGGVIHEWSVRRQLARSNAAGSSLASFPSRQANAPAGSSRLRARPLKDGLLESRYLAAN
jgi:hypothetical protein